MHPSTGLTKNVACSLHTDINKLEHYNVWKDKAKFLICVWHTICEEKYTDDYQIIVTITIITLYTINTKLTKKGISNCKSSCRWSCHGMTKPADRDLPAKFYGARKHIRQWLVESLLQKKLLERFFYKYRKIAAIDIYSLHDTNPES